MSNQFAKAVRALFSAAPISRAIEVDGHDGHVGAVLRLDRHARPSVWFVVDYRRGVVRRICTY